MANEPKKPDELDPREEPDDDAEARAFIMARRAKFVAAALAGAGLLAACGGETGGSPQPCLSPAATGGNTGKGGTAIGGSTNSGGFNVCLSSGGYNNGTGGWCLQPPTGGYQGYGGAGGFSACLSPPRSGGEPGYGGAGGAGGVPPVDAGDDAASTGGTAGTGGTLGTGGMPVPCLSIPASKKPRSEE